LLAVQQIEVRERHLSKSLIEFSLTGFYNCLFGLSVVDKGLKVKQQSTIDWICVSDRSLCGFSDRAEKGRKPIALARRCNVRACSMSSTDVRNGSQISTKHD
jgi:hypothetical protein